MWEYCLNIKIENSALADKLYLPLEKVMREFGGVITRHEEEGYIKILLAVKKSNCEKVRQRIAFLIEDVICCYFKESFLEKYLVLPEYDKIGMSAFKKALLNFDRETDRYIVRRSLVIEKDLYLDSFFDFRLKSLKNKWLELVSLSNENKEYLISGESFIDLLKFLVDNLDICEDEISVVKDEEGYKIFGENNSLLADNLFSEENIVSSVIELSPQKINLYFKEPSKAINLLERIFEERITINNHIENVKKFVVAK